MKVKEFVERNQIKVLLYKGGIIEKRLCNEINVPNYNIEKLSVKKANSHQPSVEVKDYLTQLETSQPSAQAILCNQIQYGLTVALTIQ